jgi:acetyl-CoA carboxylase carboxyl transferase subunit beta
MEWFKKAKAGIDSASKKEIPDGLWTKCPDCGEIIYVKELEKSCWVCRICSHHFRLKSDDYIKMILDDGRLEEHDTDLVSGDPLRFKDLERYPARLKQAEETTGLKEAVRVGIGKIDGRTVSFAVMDFRFIGGSMGSVVGEKVARAIERSLKQKIPLVVISASGGARMQEGILSLMQMAKTSALLSELQKTKVPYISILTDPTTAGVMASYASLGDIVIAEPRALLGFAGQRVIQQTIKQELPEGFQTSEFFLEHGFVDLISPRKDLRKNLSLLLGYLCNH